MNYIEIVVSFGLTLLAWFGNEFVAMFSEPEAPYFAYVIDSADDPIITRTGAGFGYARTGLIYGGTFRIIAHSIHADDNSEWAIIRISQFSNAEVFIPVDLTKMTTTFVKRDKLFAYGSDILWD